MKSIEIRQKFFDFFVAREHTRVPSSSLIPANDPTLLFTNAGMNQFKGLFLGTEKRSYTRAVSIQKCMRAGGKHNDLDNVGRTARHCTFFEMLGNFSFGDYFKREAIHFAWEFLTTEMKLEADKLSASVYEHDDEAYEIWHKEIGLPKERIARLGRKDNFWQMGDTGPCGPCSEIYYDRGARTKEEKKCKVGDDCERFLEVWNLVFMQFDRQTDGRELPLSRTGIDTGMGLERLCSIIQDTPTVFETDLFLGLIKKIEELSGKSYGNANPETQVAFRVLADHIRSTSLAIADGAMPDNDGRGYVLRKIIRRAALFAQQLGNIYFFAQLAPTFVDEMGGIYPELVKNRELIVNILTSELEKFSHNLIQGQMILAKYLDESKKIKEVSGEQAFKLYDTYGFPLELTSIVAHEKGYKIDIAGFEKAMAQQREQSGKKREDVTALTIDTDLTTEFVGYDKLSATSTITGIFIDGKKAETCPAGTKCWIITAQTPAYVESGGQMSDTAEVTIGGKTVTIQALQKVGRAVAALIEAPAHLTQGTELVITVDENTRAGIMRSHTATHLLQAALVKVLGPQVKQSGSSVSSDHLRFDFTHHKALSAEQIAEVECIVNAIILENRPVTTRQTTYQNALNSGVTAFFGEKYNPEAVRVVEVKGFSAELCGGTHVKETGTIGCFKITANSALSTGIRRITAVTGFSTLHLAQKLFQTVHELATKFKVQPEEVSNAIIKQEDALKKCEQNLRSVRQQITKLLIPSWIKNTETVNKVPFGLIEAEGANPKELKEIAIMLGNKKAGIYFVYAKNPTGFSFYLLCSPHYASHLDLRKLSSLLKDLGIKGGISGSALQGGGTELPKNLQGLISKAMATQ